MMKATQVSSRARLWLLEHLEKLNSHHEVRDFAADDCDFNKQLGVPTSRYWRFHNIRFQHGVSLERADFEIAQDAFKDAFSKNQLNFFVQHGFRLDFEGASDACDVEIL